MLVLGAFVVFLGWFSYGGGTMCITSAPTDCSETPLSPLAVAGVIAMVLAVPIVIGGIAMLAVGRESGTGGTKVP